MTKTCPNCKIENSDSAGFCQNCGTELKEAKKSVKSDETSGDGVSGFWNKQNNGGKAAIVIGICCVGLILVVAISGMFSPDKNTSTNSNNSAPTTTNTAPTTTTTAPTTTTTAVTWHSIAKFTGTGDKNTPSFTTQGNKFKVVIKATASSPQYAGIDFFAYPEGETVSFVGQGAIDSFSSASASDEFEVTASPGNYYLDVIAANLNNWNIEVFDYY